MLLWKQLPQGTFQASARLGQAHSMTRYSGLWQVRVDNTVVDWIPIS